MPTTDILVVGVLFFSRHHKIRARIYIFPYIICLPPTAFHTNKTFAG